MAKQMTSIDTSIETTDDGNKQKPKLYAKDSMDRYGDDLCQLMLSHLSFKDCFRYESVSKQFRRTVFGNVVDITITDKFIQQLLNDETNGTQLLATIAIKCANIETIDCRGISNRYEEHIPEVLDIFRDNCVHLQDIHCNLLPKSGQLLAEFGPLVTIGNIVGIGPPYNIVYFRDYAAVNVCHRLSHLRLKCSLHDVFDTNSDIRFVKSVRKLELHSDYTVIVDNDRWSAFVAHNQCLQSLAVKSYWFLAAKELTKWGRQVSRLAQLRQLTVGMVLGIPGDVPDSSVVNQCLHTIGVNCKQLYHVSFGLRYHEAIEPSLPLLLDSLRYYSRLKRLDLTLLAAIDDRLLDTLRHCKRLTHLELCLPKMTANVLKDLHINCPRLQCLRIRDLNNIIDTECLNRISSLPALQTLVVISNHNIDLLDKDFSDLLTKSAKLKYIEIIGQLITKYFYLKRVWKSKRL